MILFSFVFLIFNNFLPNLISLKIRKGTIDAFSYLYKKLDLKRKKKFINGKKQLNLENYEIYLKI